MNFNRSFVMVVAASLASNALHSQELPSREPRAELPRAEPPMRYAVPPTPSIPFHRATPRFFDRAEQPRGGWLGLSLRPWAGGDGSMEILAIAPASPAERAALRPGDRIIRWNDRIDIVAAVRSGDFEAGDTVRLRISRPGEADREVRLVAETRQTPIASLFRGGITFPPGGFSGWIPITDDSLRSRLYQRAIPFRTSRDSLRIQADSVRVQADSLRARFNQFRVSFRTGQDSLRIQADSLRLQADSLQSRLRALLRDSLGPELERWRGFRDAEPIAGSLGIGLTGGRNGVAGAELTELTAGLSSYFGRASGVLVLRVAPETPAAIAGLLEGDVIVGVEGEEVSNVTEIRRSLTAAQATSRARGQRTSEIALEILRHGARQTLTLRR